MKPFFKNRFFFPIAAASLVSFSGTVHAAPVNWGTPTSIVITNDEATEAPQILNEGTIGASYNNGASGTSNGVTFPSSNGTITLVESNATVGNWAINPQATEFQKVISGYHYGSSMVFTASNLTIGQDYKVQFFNYNAPGATITSGNSVTIDDQYVIGTFKADAETQVFNISSGGGINAAQIRIVNDSWTPADGIWTGGDGNWNTVGNWQANTIGQGIDKSATFNGLTPVTATVDVIRPIGALNFSGANHTLAAGSGSLTLDVDTLTAPTVTVADGITATIAGTLGGSEGMVKDGIGTLVLSGNNNYSGGTTVSVGTLKLDLGLKSDNPPLGSFAVESGATLNLDNTNTTVGSYYPQSFVLSGQGTLTKTNTGSIDFWSGSNLTSFTGTVDVQEGSLRVNNIGAAANMGQATLNIALGATFDVRYNASLSVDKLTGSGTLDQTFDGGSGLSVTVGSNNGSSTFNGVIQNGSGQPLALTKSGTGTFTLAGINTYTGNTTVNAGTLVLADDAQLKFGVTDAPAANMVTGTGTATFNGDFNIDTSGVAGTTGGIWLLVDLTNLTGESFGSTFSVIGFVDPENDGIWTMTDAKGNWSFDEATGELTLDVGSDYDDWVTANGVTGGENDDDDSDGLTNHEEYAFGLDPTGGSSVNPIATQLNKATGQFSYTRRLQSKTGLTYTVRSSSTLAANEWTNLVKDTDYTESVAPPSGDNETVTITLTPTPTAAKLFIQVKAE